MISEKMGKNTDKLKHTKAVIANANFVIGGSPEMFIGNQAVKGKEVDEWLMGSGDAPTQANTNFIDET